MAYFNKIYIVINLIFLIGMSLHGKGLEFVKKHLSSIDYMRQQIRVKNLSAPFWKLYKEKSIQVIKNGGWHFNCILTPEEISKS